MSLNRYYEKELVALRMLGKEYAERNPALAPFLDTPGRDPDVERILESFAFLSGRLRQKLEDELPEITHALFNLLWPNYLRPVPSCSVIKYMPTVNTSATALIPKNTLVESEPVEDTRCRFKTVYDVEIQPLQITNLSFIAREGKAIMQIHFGLINSSLENLALNALTFFLNGEPAITHTLYLYLVRKARSISVVAASKTGAEHTLAVLEPQSLSPLGFGDDEALFPYPPNSFPGYRILQEYFCFPEKYHFVRLGGLQAAFNRATLSRVEGSPETFHIDFLFDDLPGNFESFSKDNIHLFCTPVVNIFPKSATPLTFDHKENEYRIVPDPTMPYSFSTYSVEKVTSRSSSNVATRTYKAFESFDHIGENNEHAAYYRLRIRPAVKDQSIETWISIVRADKSHQDPDEIETLSLELLCTNRLLPGKLRVGDIRLMAEKTSNAVDFRNIIPVTPPYMPPIEGDILWKLLSNMSLNYIPLTNIKALRAILNTYDFRALHDHRRAKVLEQSLLGMISITSEETDRLYRSLPIRGLETLLILEEKRFSCEGEMVLFASVLNEFFALYATVNSFHKLTVQESGSGKSYEWPARLGATRI